MTIENEDDLQGLRAAGKVVAQTLETMAMHIEEGISTRELDEIAGECLRRCGATSAPRKAYQFPGHTCISVNSTVAHGIPNHRKLRSGDLVNLDVSAELEGYWADTGASFAVGHVNSRLQKLLRVTKQALEDAIACVKPGRFINVVGRAVQRRARKAKFAVLEDLCGHGVGRFIHEAPQIPNTFQRSNTEIFHEGMVVAIEPFVTLGARRVMEAEDGWSLKTVDGSLGAQFEHTVVVTRGAPLILTSLN